MNFIMNHSIASSSKARNPHLPDEVVQVRMENRYRGYPNAMMESPRIPVTYPNKTDASKNALGSQNVQSENIFRIQPEQLFNGNKQIYQQKDMFLPGSSKVPQLALTGALERNSKNVAYEREGLYEMDGFKLDDDIQRLKELKKRQMILNDLQKERSSNVYQIDKHPIDRNDNEKEGPTIYKAESGDESFYPWGRGHGHPRRDSQGNVVRYRFHDKLGSNVIPPRGNDEPILSNNQSSHSNGFVNQENMSSDVRSDNSLNNGIFYPFGTPGGGAPNRDNEGNIVTSVYGPSTIHRDIEEERKKLAAAKLYNNELEKEALQQHLKMLEDRQHVRAPIGELAEILRQGRVGKPKRDERTGLLLDHHLGTSDVTDLKHISPRRQHEMPSRSGHTQILNEYARELQRAAEERKRLHQLQKLQELQEVRKHQLTFDDMWGRPGGGAPRVEGTKMVDFEQALYYPSPVRNKLWEPVAYEQPIAKTYYHDQDVNLVQDF